MFNRKQRDALALEIRGYLNENVSAFEFDERLDQYRDSGDTAVRFVAHAVWFHYDDCKDHKVNLSKPEWDYFQRLLLLLASDHELETTSIRKWSWTQLLAVLSLVGFFWCVWRFGVGEHLLAFAIPFGCVSILISFIRNRTGAKTSEPYQRIIFPFATFTQLASTYKAVAFSKKRFPKRIAERRVHSRVAEFGMRLQMYAGWLMFSPIPLMFQTLPASETTTSVKAV